MRDNTSTARLEDTPTPEQDSSTAPEPDFEFQEGQDTVIARAALPQVIDVIPGPQAWHLTLKLEGGAQVELAPDRMKWAALHPGGLSIGPVLTVCWAATEYTAYAAPAALLPVLLPYFPGLEEDQQ